MAQISKAPSLSRKRWSAADETAFSPAATIRKSQNAEELLADLYRASTESQKYTVDKELARHWQGKTFILDLTSDSRPLHANGGLASDLKLAGIYKNERWLHDYFYEPEPSLFGPWSKNIGEFTTSFDAKSYRSIVKGAVPNSQWINYRVFPLSDGMRAPLARQTARQVMVSRTFELLGLIERSH